MKYVLKAKLVSLHHALSILDENENVVYNVESKAVSVHDKTYINNADGEQVAYIYAKLLSLHETHYVEMADGTNFEMSTELFHLTKDIINIDSLEWQVRGDFTEHNYEIVDTKSDKVLASTHRRWISLHNVYEIEVFEEELRDKLIAVFIVLEHNLRSRDITKSSNSADSKK